MMMILWPLYQDWIDLAVRWLHVICAMAWIGSSFYFVHLDLSLRKRAGLPEAVRGEAWQVHGGGFYHILKYTVAPADLPAHLTWFKWEAYMTFWSGLVLLILHYFFNAQLLLIDKTICDLTPGVAVALACGFLLLGYGLYEVLCRSPLKSNDFALLGAFYMFLVICIFLLTQIFSGKGAFIILGALTAIVMAANVALIIIPNQRKIVAALMKGEEPDAILGAQGKQRSLHNNYLTLAVLFLMLSNHYPLAFASRYNWVIAALALLISGLLRHFFNQRHAGHPSPWWVWACSAVCFIVMIWLSTLGPGGAYTSADLNMRPQFAQVQDIIVSRCSMCHAKVPVWDGLVAPPRGVMLESEADIAAHKAEIAKQAVWTQAMPPGGNITEMPPEERLILAQWIASGAQ